MPRNRNKMPNKGVKLNMNNNNENLYEQAKMEVQAPKKGSLSWFKQSLENMMPVKKRTINSNNLNNSKRASKRALNSSTQLNNILAESTNITQKHKKSLNALSKKRNTAQQMARKFLAKQAQNQEKKRRQNMRQAVQLIRNRNKSSRREHQRGNPASAVPSESLTKASGKPRLSKKKSKKVKKVKK